MDPVGLREKKTMTLGVKSRGKKWGGIDQNVLYAYRKFSNNKNSKKRATNPYFISFPKAVLYVSIKSTSYVKILLTHVCI